TWLGIRAGNAANAPMTLAQHQRYVAAQRQAHASIDGEDGDGHIGVSTGLAVSTGTGIGGGWGAAAVSVEGGGGICGGEVLLTPRSQNRVSIVHPYSNIGQSFAAHREGTNAIGSGAMYATANTRFGALSSSENGRAPDASASNQGASTTANVSGSGTTYHT